MAKSLRSKWKRKMRAVKRVRYGEKELERLKKCVGEDVKHEVDEVMDKETVIVTTVKGIKKKDLKGKGDKEKSSEGGEEVEEKMDDGTVQHKYNTKTMKDQFGSYPVWMHQRKISKSKKARKGRPKRK